MFRLFECCALSFFERFVLSFSLKIERFVSDSAEIWICGLYEAMRHFKHCTVGLYAQYSDQGKENGGFKVIMMIPPYKRKARKVMVRPASNFRLTYDIQGQPYAVKMYTTDPEENEREGHYDRNRLQWGANRMEPDFTNKEGGRP